MYLPKENYESKEKLKEEIMKGYERYNFILKDDWPKIIGDIAEIVIDTVNIEESINFDIKKDEFYEKLSNSVAKCKDKEIDRNITVRYNGKFNGVHMESFHYVNHGIYLDEEMRLFVDDKVGSMRLFPVNKGHLDIDVNDENVTLGHRVKQDGCEIFFIESKTDENNFIQIKIEIEVNPMKSLHKREKK